MHKWLCDVMVEDDIIEQEVLGLTLQSCKFLVFWVFREHQPRRAF
jgi:hypothetical protein